MKTKPTLPILGLAFALGLASLIGFASAEFSEGSQEQPPRSPAAAAKTKAATASAYRRLDPQKDGLGFQSFGYFVLGRRCRRLDGDAD